MHGHINWWHGGKAKLKLYHACYTDTYNVLTYNYGIKIVGEL